MKRLGFDSEGQGHRHIASVYGGMNEKVKMMRAVLAEAARELMPNAATQAKMAETIVARAADGATRQELMAAALEAGKTPAA